MADVSSVTNHFATPKEGFTTTLSGTISSGAATVPLTSVSGLTNGNIFVGIVDPLNASKQAFTGTVDTAGLQITGVVWTEGSNTGHTAGATVVDYVAATHLAMMTKGLLVNHTQGGQHKTLTDDNGNEWLERGQTAGAVNHVKLTNATTGNNAKVEAAGGDTNVNLELAAKGSGTVVLPASTVTNSNVAAGIVVQVVASTYSAVATGTADIPDDDTIPQNTEGDEYMTISITPKSATNRLIITCNAMLALSTAAGNMIMALFQDSTASALAAGVLRIPSADAWSQGSLTHEMAAGTTSSTTFKFRAGPQAGGATTTFNGSAGARKLGAIPKSSIIIYEVKV